jgi:pilus assembly protein Flp/PilA
MKTLINLMKDDSGASAAEYALILAIVGTAMAGAAIILGDTIANSMKDAANCVDHPTDQCDINS